MFSVSLPQSSNIFKRFKTIRAIGVSALRPTTAALTEMMIASVTNDGGNGDTILDARCCCQIYAIYPFHLVKKLVWHPRISVEKPQNPGNGGMAEHGMEPAGLMDFVLRSCYKLLIDIWVFPKTGGKPPKWMVKIMENPMNKWMIWGAHLSMVMEPKYLAFRRWLYIPVIIWQGDWIPRG